MIPIGTTEVWQAALAKWAEIARNIPDLEPAVAVQQRMLRILLDTAERLELDAADITPIDSDAVLGKWIRGVPAFRNETTPIPPHLNR